jgi:thymidylate synthase
MEEEGYLELVKRCIDTGVRRKGRNGDTLSLFGERLIFSLEDGNLPLLTTKRVGWKTVFRELQWFLLGRTDVKWLNDRKVHIWDDNGSREFLNGRGLHHYPEGVLGPVYGFQWRHFGASYDPKTQKPVDISTEGTGSHTHTHTHTQNNGIDQIRDLIRQINADPSSRRLILSAWNPAALNEMALPPCHILSQFWVNDGKLSCQMYQRSADLGLGVPFNIASYAILTNLIAKCCDLVPEKLVMVFGDAHVYVEHIEPLQEQLKRTPRKPPRMIIKTKKYLPDEFEEDDIEVIGYEPDGVISMKMIA